MATPHHPWVFEAELAHNPGVAYRYRVRQGGIEHIQHDPWAFRQEWMGELDRHLFAEGNHHHIWRAHGRPCGRAGTGWRACNFACGPPMPAAWRCWEISTAGMAATIRCSSGWAACWELFIPGLAEGAIYKYEVRAQNGHCYQKADPYGFRHEVRPNHGSIVAELGAATTGTMADWMEERDSRNPLDQPISVYEMHLGSWIHAAADQPYIEPDGTPRPPVPAADLKPGARLLTYPELADG